MYNKYFKRIIDVIGSIVLLPIIAIIYIIVGPLIKIEDGGPILYNSKRVGKNGILFNMHKFRTMKQNAPDFRNEDGSTFNSEKDPRLTRIGKKLRKTSLDEIPQLINVLKGDMSFVGPRPDTPKALEIYTEEDRKKLNTKPGITGYNQAYFRNSIPQNYKFKNDVFYTENISFIFDLMIIIQTVKSVIFRENINNKEG